MDPTQKLLRSLPKVDEILSELLGDLKHSAPNLLIKLVIQKTLQTERESILQHHGDSKEKSRSQWLEIIKKNIVKMQSPNLQRVINNWGRLKL